MYNSEKRRLLESAAAKFEEKKKSDDSDNAPISVGCYVDDFDDSSVIICRDGKYYKAKYSMDNDLPKIEDKKSWTEVVRRESYAPVSGGEESKEDSGEDRKKTIMEMHEA